MTDTPKVAFLGPVATFSHEAAHKHFGPSAQFLPMRSIPDVFFATARHEVDFGIVPVENALEGAVTYTLDMFAQPDPQLADLTIEAEVHLPIIQNLLVAPDGPTRLEDITVVYSHPQALAQCRGWLLENLPHAELQEVLSTSRAAELARANPQAAGIGNRLAVEEYGVRVFASNLQDADFNQTRFLVIASRSVEAVPMEDGASGRYTTAVMLSIKDRVGALHAVTSVFTKYGLNMNRIESRPSKQKAWDYLFFIDFIGHPAQPPVAAALDELADETVWVKLLGSWRREI